MQALDGAGGTDRPPPLDRIAAAAAARFGPESELVVERLRRWWPAAEAALRRVYRAAVDDVADRLGSTLLQLVEDRSAELRRLDSRREAVPDWFQQPGGRLRLLCRSVRRDFAASRSTRLPQRVGVTYLHLMPLLHPRPGPTTAGTRSDYRAIRPELGTMMTLGARDGAARRGIALSLDLVINHVAREHEWAQRALAGDASYRDFIFLPRPRRSPTPTSGRSPRCSRTSRRAASPGCRSRAGCGRRSTSSSGTSTGPTPMSSARARDHPRPGQPRRRVLRLDAVAFIWKRLGTTARTSPRCTRRAGAPGAAAIAAPAVVFKAEAIVGARAAVPTSARRARSGRV